MFEATLLEKGLKLNLPSGQAYFNYFWLRDNCPSSFDPQTRERVFDLFALEQDPKAKAAIVENRRLVIDWEEDHRSYFDLSWLEQWATVGSRSDPAAVKRNLWYGNHFQQVKRFKQADLELDQNLVCDWARALLDEGITIVTEMRNSDQSLTDLAHLLGEVRSSVSGNYFDVRVHIDPVNLSFTASALEMHTDTPAEELPPGIQFLHCRANSVDGGNSLFLDGAAVAEDFRKAHPSDFDILSTTKVPFYYEHDDFDWRSRQRVIELDDQGNVSGLTFSQHMADVFDLPQEELDLYYPAFRRFGRWLLDPKYLMTFRLNAGECIVFDNHRIVHGREGYTASSGERYLRGCYVDRGELRSTYRILSKKRLY